eukprot:31302-Prymnesium_polylepis.3
MGAHHAKSRCQFAQGCHLGLDEGEGDTCDILDLIFHLALHRWSRIQLTLELLQLRCVDLTARHALLERCQIFGPARVVGVLLLRVLKYLDTVEAQVEFVSRKLILRTARGRGSAPPPGQSAHAPQA